MGRQLKPRNDKKWMIEISQERRNVFEGLAREFLDFHQFIKKISQNCSRTMFSVKLISGNIKIGGFVCGFCKNQMMVKMINDAR